MTRLVILGSGESGTGTAVLAQQKGLKVFVSDRGQIQEKYKTILEQLGVEWEDGQHTEAKILNADLVMKSPGIPDTVPLVKQLVAQGTPVISEMEFASRYSDAVTIGITGSNGKTTTTMMTYHLLKGGGVHAGICGNIGDSYAQMVAQHHYDYHAVEISNFQLDGIIDFKPHIAILTNITPDHLDRYEYKFENYIASKFRIAMNQNENDYFIYDADDPVIQEGLQKHPVRAKRIPFSIQQQLKEGAWLESDTIHINIENISLEMNTNLIPVQGQHNVKNAMAASLTALLVKVRKETIRQSIQTFQGASHRLEKVLKIKDVEYINDSKATNTNSVYYALEGIKKPIVWIAGGVDKGNDYSEIMPLVREKVKAIICLGTDNTKLIKAFGNVINPMVETQSMEEAVKIAYKLAEPGDTVLLSPACASFDLFKNFEVRGDQFKEAVRNL